MARGPLQPGTLGSKAEQLAARAEGVAKITAVLQEGPKSTPDICAATGLNRPLAFSYLRHMRETLRTVRILPEQQGRSDVWALGEDPNVPTEDEKLDRLIAVKQARAPAQQIGMRRDPLVAALFGPAMGAAA